MPNGHTHDAVTWFCAAPVGYGAWLVAHDWPGALITGAAFAFAGLMFGGDLDLPSSQYRRWGVLRWIWKPYQWVVPHRSVISHGLLLGPLGRLLYLALVATVAMVLGVRLWAGEWRSPTPNLEAAVGWLGGIPPEGWAYLAYMLAGLWLGGASHSLADWGWSAVKRRMRR